MTHSVRKCECEHSLCIWCIRYKCLTSTQFHIHVFDKTKLDICQMLATSSGYKHFVDGHCHQFCYKINQINISTFQWQTDVM